MLFRRIVVQVWTEPALDFRYIHRFALVIVDDLVAVDFAEDEIARFRVGEVESADAGAGPHGERLGDLHAGVGFYIEQTPERAFFRVIGTGRVPGGGPDAAILFLDEVRRGKVFAAAVAPFVTH